MSVVNYPILDGYPATDNIADPLTKPVPTTKSPLWYPLKSNRIKMSFLGWGDVACELRYFSLLGFSLFLTCERFLMFLCTWRSLAVKLCMFLIVFANRYVSAKTSALWCCGVPTGREHIGCWFFFLFCFLQANVMRKHWMLITVFIIGFCRRTRYVFYLPITGVNVVYFPFLSHAIATVFGLGKQLRLCCDMFCMRL